MRRLGAVLAMVVALSVLAVPAAHADEVCRSAWFIAEKYGVPPIHGNYGEIETALAAVCSNTP